MRASSRFKRKRALVRCLLNCSAMPQDVVTPSDFPKSWSFEPTGRLVHLRWAVAEIAISIDTPSAALDTAERALRIFGPRATTLIRSLETDSDTLADAFTLEQ